LRLAAAVGSAEECLALLVDLRPDVISMDIHLPGMDGLAATSAIMAEHPTPIVVVSSSIRPGEVQLSMEALRAGAVAVVEKPSGPGAADHGLLAARMCTQLAIMSEVQVVRQRARLAAIADCGRFPPPGARHRLVGSESRLLPIPGVPGCRRGSSGIAAPTGGPAAFGDAVRRPRRRFPPAGGGGSAHHPGFMPGFVAWLRRWFAAAGGARRRPRRPAPGCIHLAPDGMHLTVANGHLPLGGR